MIKSFDIASDTVLHGTYILKNIVCGNIFGINYASDIQIVDHVVEGKTVYFGNQFGIGDRFGKKSQEYIFFIQVCEGYECFCSGKPFFHKERTVRTVAIDDGCIRQKITEGFAACCILFDDFYRDIHIQQGFGQVIGNSSATDDDSIFYLVGFQPDLFEKGGSIHGRCQNGYHIAVMDHIISAGD